MNTNSKQKLMIGIFLAVLFLPMVGAMLGVGQADWKQEKRDAVSFPQISRKGLRKATWFAEISDYLRDHLPYRQKAVAFYSGFNLRQLGETGSTKVLAGRDGWLFLNEELDGKCVAPEVIAERVERLRGVADRLKKQYGTRLVWVFPPDKAAIYPEKLTGTLARRAECATKNREALRAVLKEPVNAPYFLGLWDVLEQAKANEPEGKFVWRLYDTHWNYKGASIAANALMDWIKPGIWRQDWVIPTKEKPRAGDLSRMLGLPDLKEPDMGYERELPGIRVEKAGNAFCARDLKLTVNEPSVAIASEENTVKQVSGPAVLVRDSFFMAMKPFALPYFQQLDIVHFTEVDKLGLEKLAKCADLVILESVERHAIYRMEQVLNQLDPQPQEPAAH